MPRWSDLRIFSHRVVVRAVKKMRPFIDVLPPRFNGLHPPVAVTNVGHTLRGEHTHDLSDTLPNSFLSENLGYVGISNIPTNDEGWRLNTLYWDQKFQGGRYELVVGYLDISDYVDVYPLTSPWTDFFNYAFSIGAGALDLTNDASLGFAGAAWLTDSVTIFDGCGWILCR